MHNTLKHTFPVFDPFILLLIHNSCSDDQHISFRASCVPPHMCNPFTKTNSTWHQKINREWHDQQEMTSSSHVITNMSRFTFCFMSCLVISCFILKITNFPLSFQVSCPSSRVKHLIVFPDSQSVSTCSPWSLMCSNSLRLPVSCASMLSPSMSFITSLLIPVFHVPWFYEPAVSVPPAEHILCV